MFAHITGIALMRLMSEKPRFMYSIYCVDSATAPTLCTYGHVRVPNVLQMVSILRSSVQGIEGRPTLIAFRGMAWCPQRQYSNRGSMSAVLLGTSCRHACYEFQTNCRAI